MDFCGNAFLHNMVRIMVGCLIEVGSGKRPVSWLSEVRDARDRARAAATAESAGLYLADVDYGSRWDLPSGPGRRPLDLQELLATCR
jgi:tRNA pseudouridine38-40 synthase